MKIIDEKGKLFGKINVIDFLVILFLVSFVPMFYFGYKLLTKESAAVVVGEPLKEFKEIEIRCKFVELETEDLKTISVGDQELDKEGKIIGEIINLGESAPYETYEYKFDIGNGEKIAKEITGLKQLKAKLKLKAEVKQNKLYYKNKPIKIDLPLQFKTTKYSLIAIPLPMERTATLRVKFTRVMPEVAEMVKEGDRQVGITADNNKIIAKIVRIINEPAEVVALMNDRRTWSIVGHPKYRDLVLEIEVLCELRKGELSFSRLKVGSSFNFTTDLYSISGIIMEVKKNNEDFS